MQDFATLFEELDTTTSTLQKTSAMERHLARASPADAAWAVYFLSGHRVRRLVGPALLREWLAEASGLPAWLVEETYSQVGDLAETIALLVASPDAAVDGAAAAMTLGDWMERRILPLRTLDPEAQRAQVTAWWRTLPLRECFLVNKLLTGALRVGVSGQLVLRAVAAVTGHPAELVARRLLGDWTPSAAFWEGLCAAAPERVESPSQPYPFFLAHPVEGEPAALGAAADFIAEWKWDGIRAQVIRRSGEVHVWSRGIELVTPRFPEVAAAAAALPDGTVLDGELLAWRDDQAAPFALLQTRIGRKRPTARALREAPVRFLAYDLLEAGGADVRSVLQWQRRERLESLLAGVAPGAAIGLSPRIVAGDWESLAQLRDQARARGVEGLMLKARSQPYGTGRQRGGWWKWKVAPYSFDGVLLYAQPGHGRRSNLYTDYSFAVWHDGQLVVVAKAYSGLTNAEIEALDRWIRAHTVEKFGPVRSVEPQLVFELAFEGIARSTRHKAGIALRFPRILRRREDKAATQADTLQDLERLLHAAA